MLSRLFIAELWSHAGKELTSWLLFVMFNCVCVTFPCGILGQAWYLIVSIPDLSHKHFIAFLNQCNEFKIQYIEYREHVSSCINICPVPRKLFEHEAARPSVQTSSEGPGKC